MNSNGRGVYTLYSSDILVNLSVDHSADELDVDEVCGPRCVQYVLKCFGTDVDLIEVVREAQWPRLEQGATLTSLADALKRRGIFTFPMHIGSDIRLKSPYPVIVHVKDDECINAIGHYVVWLPSSSGGNIRVWWGLEGVKLLRESDWTEKRSGAILLCEPNAITTPDAALEKITIWPTLSSLTIFSAILLVIIVARKGWFCFVSNA